MLYKTLTKENFQHMVENLMEDRSGELGGARRDEMAVEGSLGRIDIALGGDNPGLCLRYGRLRQVDASLTFSP